MELRFLPMGFKIQSVSDVDLPEFWQSLSESSRAFLERGNLEILRQHLRASGFPETRPDTSASQPPQVLRFPAR